MLLFYIRHGDPTYDPDELTPLGKRQAESVAKRLALYGIDRIFASTSNRAIQTARPTCEILKKEMTLLESITYACGTAIGFTLALVIFAGIREQLALTKVPKAMQGIPIALVTAGILAMAFMGFSGLV